MPHQFSQSYTNDNLARLSYPLGGIGAGGMCITGSGELEAVALRHRAAVFNRPLQFASVHLRGVANGTRVLEGPVPTWRPLFPWGAEADHMDSGTGGRGSSYGFPRFLQASFLDSFPAGVISLTDDTLPISAVITAWNPFIPGDAHASSQPAIVVEYALTNTTESDLDAVVGFHAMNHLAVRNDRAGVGVDPRTDGFVLRQDAVDAKHEQGAMRVSCDADDVCVDTAWFRGGWFDESTMLWRHIAAGQHVTQQHNDTDTFGPSRGGSVTAAVKIPAGATTTVRFRLTWFVPFSDVSTDRHMCDCGGDGCCETPSHEPYYAGVHASVDAVDDWLRTNLDDLRSRSFRFGEVLSAGDLPGELREAVMANLGILRSPTMLRQRDGRMWLWEGCLDNNGCCPGSCTHVWNWAQALAHLFPDLERTLREVEHGPQQMEDGGQRFRMPLPIEQVAKRERPAVDGQLGGIVKAWRDWRIAGDSAWLEKLWPALKQSLEYMIKTFDPSREGVLRGPQHNTYDIEFHGPNAMSMSCYLAALCAAADMAQAAGEAACDYTAMADRCRAYLQDELWDGQTFVQQLEVRTDLGEDVSTNDAGDNRTPELRELTDGTGPRYQCTTGVLTTALLGEWLAAAAGVETGLDKAKVRAFLASVIEHNLRRSLVHHANPQRPSYAFGSEGGLILCTWPKGDAPPLPFPYSEEVWTGIEYQIAGHLLRVGMAEEAREVVAIARQRYDGQVRNPFDEIECGHWYGRALASYDLLGAYSGARYDAITRTMYLAPTASGDFAAPFFAGDCWGLVGMRRGKPSYTPYAGDLQIDEWVVTDPNA